MTDFTTGEAPIEREPQATAVDVPAPATVGAAAAPPTDAPAAAPDIAYPVGSTPQLVLDHFVDSEGDQSMNQIKTALPHIAQPISHARPGY